MLPSCSAVGARGAAESLRSTCPLFTRAARFCATYANGAHGLSLSIARLLLCNDVGTLRVCHQADQCEDCRTHPGAEEDDKCEHVQDRRAERHR